MGKIHPHHLHLPENTLGRDFFLGDPHGRLDALLLAMDEVGFDPLQDRIICVGDLIDRGPRSYELLQLTREPWFFSVRGNHETMLLETNDDVSLANWIANGGNWFLELDGEKALDAYGLSLSLPTAITVDITGDRCVGVCHADWPGADWVDAKEAISDDRILSEMLWGRTTIRTGRTPEDKTATLTIHGHTPIENPIKTGTALFIDTGCVYGGKLTLIELSEALALPQSDYNPAQVLSRDWLRR